MQSGEVLAGRMRLVNLPQRSADEPGYVLTIEPGLYIPAGTKGVAKKWQGIGIRIEDDVLLTEHPTIVSIADAHQATPGQVLIAWALARGTSVIPKSG